MNFFQYTRIFLAPIFQAKWYTFTFAFEVFLWSLLPMVSVFLVGDLMRVLQLDNLSMLYSMMRWYIVSFFGIILLIVLMYRSGWVRFLETIQSILYHKYIGSRLANF